MKKNRNIMKAGILTIEDQVLKLLNNSINISNIDNMENYTYKRHSLSYGVKSWIKGLIFFIIIIAIFYKSFSKSLLNFLIVLYFLILFILLYYNYNKHKACYFGLAIYTIRSEFIIQSNDKKFLNDIENTIINAINHRYSYYTINIDNHSINSNNVNSDFNSNVINSNNITNIEFNFKNIYEELNILEENCEEDLKSLKDACKKEDKSKLMSCLKKLKKETISLIKSLGLTALTKLVENLL